MRNSIRAGLVTAVAVAATTLGSMYRPAEKGAPHRIIGTLVEPGGYALTANIALAVRMSLGESDLEAWIKTDGTFRVDLPPNTRDRRLEVSVAYHNGSEGTGFPHGVARRTFLIRRTGAGTLDLGKITLPEAPDLGAIRGRVRSASSDGPGIDLDIGDLIQGGDQYPLAGHQGLSGAANAPYLYVRGDSYLLAHAPPGRYRLGLSSPGYQEGWIDVVILPGRMTSNRDLLLVPSRFTLSGVLLDKDSGKPLPSVLVSTWSGKDSRGFGYNLNPTFEWGETDEQGNFRIALRVRKVSGGISVRAHAEGYEREVLKIGSKEFESGRAARVRVELARIGR